MFNVLKQLLWSSVTVQVYLRIPWFWQEPVPKQWLNPVTGLKTTNCIWIFDFFFHNEVIIKTINNGTFAQCKKKPKLETTMVGRWLIFNHRRAWRCSSKYKRWGWRRRTAVNFVLMFCTSYITVKSMSSEISDFQNCWLQAICACAEWYSRSCISQAVAVHCDIKYAENWLLGLAQVCRTHRPWSTCGPIEILCGPA